MTAHFLGLIALALYGVQKAFEIQTATIGSYPFQFHIFGLAFMLGVATYHIPEHMRKIRSHQISRCAHIISILSGLALVMLLLDQFRRFPLVLMLFVESSGFLAGVGFRMLFRRVLPKVKGEK